MALSQQVMVNFEYQYTARDGTKVSIKPNEHYILVAKTNENWWHVQRDQTEKPFYIPAKYVTEIPSENNQTPLDPPLEFSGEDSTYMDTMAAPAVPTETLETVEVTLRGPESINHDLEKHVSTTAKHIESNEFFTPKVVELSPAQTELQPEAPIYDTVEGINHIKSSSPSSPTNGETPVSVFHPCIHAISTAPNPETISPHTAIEDPGKKQEEVNTLDQDIEMLIRAGWSSEIFSIMSKDKGECVDGRTQELYNNITEMEKTHSSGAEDKSRHRRGFYRPLSRIQVENDGSLTEVYVNIPRARHRTLLQPPDTLLLDSAGWEVHTDHQSGLEYYYQPSTGRSTWECPLSRSMEPLEGIEETWLPSSSPQSLSCSPVGPSPLRKSSDWEKVLDENTGRHYFFNTVSGQSSWDPPEEVISAVGFLNDSPPSLPEEDYPSLRRQQEESSPVSLSAPAEYSLLNVKRISIPRASLDHSTPPGWTLNIDPEGTWVLTSDYTQEQWIKSLDDEGRTYYYLRDGTKSLWNLPEYSESLEPYSVGNGHTVEQDTLGHNWRHSAGYQEDKLHSSCRQNASDSDASSSPEVSHNFIQVSNLEKAGILNKTKISENGKKIRKNWGHSWTVLHGGILIFHKDPKSAQTGGSNKTNQIVPEFTVDLKGATIGRASKDKSSKKNVLELKSRTGVEYLIQYDTESIITDWHKVILDTIRQLSLQEVEQQQQPFQQQHHSEDEEEISEKSSSLDRDERSLEKRTMSIATTRQLSTSSTSEADQKKVRTKLKKFLLKRPTLQSVKDKGYIRENVFGCHLLHLCAQEKRTVPTFVEKCIRTVERRGLGIDGLYRVSGNLAVIQKLRFKADHEDLDLDEGNWDIHVITGALKLFFRELQEPLFPYSLFGEFVYGIKIPEYYSKILHMRNLILSLPAANRDTMEALFSHLRKVIQHGNENRMTVQNVAIVFGPTLLKPELETANIAAYMVYQNQIVEFMLNEFESIFHM